MVDELPDRAVKGRGAISNRSGRFETMQRVRIDDGWGRPPTLVPELRGLGTDDTLGVEVAFEDEEPPRSQKTILRDDLTKTIISQNDSPDIGFDQSINPYRGCEHGCIYCYARPGHAFLGLSPGIDFETILYRKTNAAQLLAEALRKKNYVCRTLALGAVTDPYQPVERTERITRSLLEVCRDFNQPVGITTKGALVTRDIDILAPMAAKGLVSVALSITSLDPQLARSMEPRASSPTRRLAAIRALAKAGIPVAVLTSPMIPGLNDQELEAILVAAVEAGATSANYILLRLPLEVADLFEEWLRSHVPDRADRILSLIKQCRDGNLYQAGFGDRMKGTGPYAELIRNRFNLAVKKLGIKRRLWTLETAQFQPPPRPGDQLCLL